MGATNCPRNPAKIVLFDVKPFFFLCLLVSQPTHTHTHIQTKKPLASEKKGRGSRSNHSSNGGFKRKKKERLCEKNESQLKPPIELKMVIETHDIYENATKKYIENIPKTHVQWVNTRVLYVCD